MGVVMMSGIMAIFEMGLSLTGQSLLPAPIDVYFELPEGNQASGLDRDLLELLANPDDVIRGLTFQDLCDAVDQSYMGSASFVSKPIMSGRWIGSCKLSIDSSVVSHRVLIQPHPLGSASLPYKLFSCTSERDDYQCLFEKSE